jgi:2,3-bisphosphoglycerate-dependent phosphoglycerate mutase
VTGTLVLLRHGQSTWNETNLFTGWHDVPLTDRGRAEATAAGEAMAAEGLRFDELHTSVLSRAITTAHLALEAMGQLWLPVTRTWRLNERHYGALQGLDKAETTATYGAEQVKVWRRSYDVPPVPVDPASPEHPRNDDRYRMLAPEVLPGAECLADVLVRVLPHWYDDVVPSLRAGRHVLVVAHGNSLRALAKHLEGMTAEEVVDFNIPTGVPRRYAFDDDLGLTDVAYLGDPEEIAAAARAVADQATGTAAGRG